MIGRRTGREQKRVLVSIKTVALQLPLTLRRTKKLRCSLTVRRSNRTLCCGHIPRFLLIESMSVKMLQPLIRAVPSVGVYRPVGVHVHADKKMLLHAGVGEYTCTGICETCTTVEYEITSL